MYFLFSKLLSFVWTPSNWILIAIAIGAFIKNKRWKRVAFFSAFGLFLIFSNPFTFNTVAKAWEDEFYLQPMPSGSFKYAVILGGIASYDTTHHRPIFSSSSDRIFQALPLLKSGQIENLIISGGSARLFIKEPLEAVYLKDYLVSIGINKNQISIDSISRNTHENALHSSQLIKPHNRILLITSAFHMRRAVACFQKQGIHTIPFAVHPLTYRGKPGFDFYFSPSVAVLSQWQVLIKEMIGTLVYKFKGFSI